MPRYLITGGAGFIGGYLSNLLLDQGHQVVAIDDLSTGSLENIASIQHHPRYKFVRETIMNALVLDRLTSEAEVVIHLAATVGVRLIVEDPVRTIETNIMGSETVLKTANRYGCKVLIASSSEVYGKGVKVPFCEEDDRLMGSTHQSRWAYATTKAVDEFLGLAYYHQFDLPVVIMRFFNTIGPRQTGRYGMVVPRLVQQALTGQPLQVYGDGQQTRCFTDVLDVVGAVYMLSQHPEAVGQIYNIGSSEEVSIYQLAVRILELTGSNAPIQLVPYEIAYTRGFEDMQRRVPSLEKINRLIGYQPRFTLKDTLTRIIEYEKDRLQRSQDGRKD
jgi:UDP-glucose 4-epimerase